MRTLSIFLLPILLAACVEARMDEQGRRPFSRESTFPEDCTVAVERIGQFIVSIPLMMMVEIVTNPFGWTDDDDDEDDWDAPRSRSPSNGFPPAGSAVRPSSAPPAAPPPASNRHVGRRRSR